MPKQSSRNQSPKDINEIATSVVRDATRTAEGVENEKNPHAVALGRLGGLRGGVVRAERLTSEQRKEIAINAAQARWRSYEKSYLELAIDNLLLLCLLDMLDSVGDLDMLKLEKLVFLVEKNQQSRREKGFNFLFYRWNAGPFSTDLCDVVRTLTRSNIINSDPFRLTKRGRELLGGYQQYVKRADPIVRHMGNILDTYSGYSPTALRDLVYGMDIIPTGQQTPINIKNARPRRRLLMKIPERECNSTLPITEVEAATFLAETNSKLMASLRKARKY